MEVTIKLNGNQLWLLKRKYGKRLGEKRLVKMSVIDAVRAEAQKVVDETSKKLDVPIKIDADMENHGMTIGDNKNER